MRIAQKHKRIAGLAGLGVLGLIVAGLPHLQDGSARVEADLREWLEGTGISVALSPASATGFGLSHTVRFPGVAFQLEGLPPLALLDATAGLGWWQGLEKLEAEQGTFLTGLQDIRLAHSDAAALTVAAKAGGHPLGLQLGQRDKDRLPILMEWQGWQAAGTLQGKSLDIPRLAFGTDSGQGQVGWDGNAVRATFHFGTLSRDALATLPLLPLLERFGRQDGQVTLTARQVTGFPFPLENLKVEARPFAPQRTGFRVEASSNGQPVTATGIWQGTGMDWQVQDLSLASPWLALTGSMGMAPDAQFARLRVEGVRLPAQWQLLQVQDVLARLRRHATPLTLEFLPGKAGISGQVRLDGRVLAFNALQLHLKENSPVELAGTVDLSPLVPRLDLRLNGWTDSLGHQLPDGLRLPLSLSTSGHLTHPVVAGLAQKGLTRLDVNGQGNFLTPSQPFKGGLRLELPGTALQGPLAVRDGVLLLEPLTGSVGNQPVQAGIRVEDGPRVVTAISAATLSRQALAPLLATLRVSGGDCPAQPPLPALPDPKITSTTRINGQRLDLWGMPLDAPQIELRTLPGSFDFALSGALPGGSLAVRLNGSGGSRLRGQVQGVNLPLQGWTRFLGGQLALQGRFTATGRCAGEWLPGLNGAFAWKLAQGQLAGVNLDQLGQVLSSRGVAGLTHPDTVAALAKTAVTALPPLQGELQLRNGQAVLSPVDWTFQGGQANLTGNMNLSQQSIDFILKTSFQTPNGVLPVTFRASGPLDAPRVDVVDRAGLAREVLQQKIGR